MAPARGRGLKKLLFCQSDFSLISLGELLSEIREILFLATFNFINAIKCNAYRPNSQTNNNIKK